MFVLDPGDDEGSRYQRILLPMGLHLGAFALRMSLRLCLFLRGVTHYKARYLTPLLLLALKEPHTRHGKGSLLSSEQTIMWTRRIP
jgi:hypothetical protein